MDSKTTDSNIDLDKVSPTFCVAKWGQNLLRVPFGFHSNCHLTPRVHIDPKKISSHLELFNNTQTTKNERQMMLQGERPEGCNSCWVNEDAGRKSERMTNVTNDWAKETYSKIKNDLNSDLYPSYLELFITHACQFKCVYCFASVSSSIYGEYKKYGVMPDYSITNMITEKVDKYINLKEEDNIFVQQFGRWFKGAVKHVKVLRITGGEPLLSPQFFKILDQIKEENVFGINFIVNTNLCINKKFINKMISKVSELMDLGHIDKFEVYTSIEAFGEHATFIREGMDLSLFESNIDLLLRKMNHPIHLGITATFNIFSLFTFDQCLEFYAKIKKISDLHIYSFNTYPLRFPTSISTLLVDEEEFKDELRVIYDKVDSLASDGVLSEYEKEKIISSINFKDEKLRLKSQRKGDFFWFVSELEQRRNFSLSQKFPKLVGLYENGEKEAVNDVNYSVMILKRRLFHQSGVDYLLQFFKRMESCPLLFFKIYTKVFNDKPSGLLGESLITFVNESLNFPKKEELLDRIKKIRFQRYSS